MSATDSDQKREREHSEQETFEDRLLKILTIALQKIEENDFLIPKSIEVKKFSGDILEYMIFRDSITRVTDGWKVSEMTKYSWLLQNLEGEPYDSIKGLCILAKDDEEILKQAFKILDADYMKPRIQLAAVVNMMVSGEFSAQENDASSIRKFKSMITTVRGNVATLKTTLEDFMHEMALFNMDTKLRDDYESFSTKFPKQDFESLTQFLGHELCSLERRAL